MNVLSRRETFKTALAGIAGTGVLATLAACSSVATPAAGQSDVELLATGMNAVLAALSGVPGIPANILAQVQAEVNVINQSAAQIGQAISPAGSAVAQIDAAVTAVATVVTPFFPAAGGVALVVKAALALLPAIMNFFGQAVPRGAAAPTMSADQARVILGSAGSIAGVR